MAKNFNVPNLMDSSEFNKEVTGNGEINYSGSQYDGRFGSQPPHVIGGIGQPDADPDFGGINFNNNQVIDDNINDMDNGMDWEKKNGVFKDPTKTFTDIQNGFQMKEVDLKNDESSSIGMPSDSCHWSPGADCGC